MLLSGFEGNELGVMLAGYEFPDCAEEEMTANWLEVVLYVRSERGTGWCQAPALLTWDVSRLASWLEHRAQRRPPTSVVEEWIGFAEPNLQIHLEGDKDVGVAFQVTFYLERPGEWTVEGQRGAGRSWSGRMQLTVPHEQLHVAAEDLRAQERLFPPRPGQSDASGT
jgi:hypothetical protein